MTNLNFLPRHGQCVVVARDIRPQQVMDAATALAVFCLRDVYHLHHLEVVLDVHHLRGKFT